MYRSVVLSAFTLWCRPSPGRPCFCIFTALGIWTGSSSVHLFVENCTTHSTALLIYFKNYISKVCKIYKKGLLSGSVGWMSNSWFRLGSWSWGSGTKPHVGLHAQCRVCLRDSLFPFPCACLHFPSKNE